MKANREYRKARKRVRNEERKAKPAPGPTYACATVGVNRRRTKARKIAKTILPLLPRDVTGMCP